jgi:hypothetical protein
METQSITWYLAKPVLLALEIYTGKDPFLLSQAVPDLFATVWQPPFFSTTFSISFMSSNYHRPTLAFPTLFGTFLLHKSSSLYESLVLAGLPDIQKKAALSHLFHLGCLVVDGCKEVSFCGD